MLRVVDPPAPLVTLDRAKAHLRVDGDEENDLITAYIAAAQATIDGPSGWLGRALGTQTLEFRTALPWLGPSYGDAYSRASRGGYEIQLPCCPVVEVTGVTVVDNEGRETAVNSASWLLEGDDTLRFRSGVTLPNSANRSDALRIRYQAGYKPGDNEDYVWPPQFASVPAAILVMVSLLYEQRSGSGDLQSNPTVHALLSPLRVWRR